LPLRSTALFVLSFAAGVLRAEFLRVEQALGGLDCISCAQSVDKTLKKVKGVETAIFRTSDAVAVIELKPGNKAALEEIRDAVKRIGYTPKEAKVTVRGQARMEGDKWLFRVLGGDTDYPLEAPESNGIAGQVRQGAGPKIVEGSIAPGRGAALKVTSIRPGE